MKELDGQVALVTGGSRGIGLVIAQELGRAGAKVAVVGRNGEAAESAAASLEGSGHRGYGCDVSDAEGAKAVVGNVEEELGPIEILVNNAGITRDRIFIRMKEEEVGRGSRRQSQGSVQHDPCSRPRDDEAAKRCDLEHHLGGRNRGERRPGELLRLQGRPHRIHEEYREGARAAGDPFATRSPRASSRQT